MNEYEQQAKDFCTKTNTTIKVDWLKYDKYFPDDKENRDIYGITLIKGQMSYYFTFGQSINNSGFKLRYKSGTAKGKEVHYMWEEQAIKESKHDKKLFEKFCIKTFGSMGNLEIVPPEQPTEYDILTGITKNNPETFENFCSEYGYDSDSIKALDTYKKVQDEWYNIERLYSLKEIEMMQEVQ